MLRIPFLSAEAPYVLIAVTLLLFFILKPLRALRPSLINTSVFFAACLAGDLLAGIPNSLERRLGILPGRGQIDRLNPKAHLLFPDR